MSNELLSRPALLARAEELEASAEAALHEAWELRRQAKHMAGRRVDSRIERWREVAQNAGTFTVGELARAGGVVSVKSASRAVKMMEEYGWIQKTGVHRTSRNGAGHTPFPEYEFVKPENGHAPRLKEAPPEEVVARAARERNGSHPKARSGIKTGRLHVRDKDLDKLLGQCYAAKWRLSRAGAHVLAWPPDGNAPVSFASTPSDHHAYANTLAEVRKRGLEV